MYTENNTNYSDVNYNYNNSSYSNYNNGYYEEESNSTNSGDKKGLIIKILIILVCIGVLIWLIIALKNSKNKEVVYNSDIHAENVEKVRLAAEKYFFIDKNMPKNNETKVVSLNTLIGKGLVSDIVDSNKKVCNDVESISSLKEEGSVYVLRVRLSCSTNEKEEVFYYNKNTYACQNCNGKTYMDGSTNADKNKDVDNDKDNINDNLKNDDNGNKSYSCKDWSDWSDTRETSNLSMLNERTRTVVLGVKSVAGTSSSSRTCTDYTKVMSNVNYTTTNNSKSFSIGTKSNTTNIETKDVIEDVWVDKESRTPVQASSTIKPTGTKKVGGSSYTTCPSGYSEKNNKCVSDSTTKGNLTYLEYNSGNYIVENKPCDYMDTITNKNGDMEYVYVGCLYRSVKSLSKSYSNGYTVYTYQELEKRVVKYYRTCSDTVTSGQNTLEYTKEYYEEDKLPSGYSKASGSEKTQYSYMLKTCEK